MPLSGGGKKSRVAGKSGGKKGQVWEQNFSGNIS